MIGKFCLAFAVITAASSTLVSAQQTGKVTSSGIGYLEYLPDGYHSNSNRYPVVISLHGIQEKGTSSTDPELVKKDLPKVAYVGLPKYVKNGTKYPFILISPQLKNQYGSWSPHFIIEVLNYVKKTLRIDENRVYLTGLSLGGLGVWQTAGAYPHIFAAITPICPGGNALSKASAIAAENVAAWGFHGGSDYQVPYSVTTNMINAMNSSPKKPNPLAKVTIFAGMGHSIWDKVYHQTDALNWMLTFRNGTTSSSPATPSNISPVVQAGTNKTITLPYNSLYIEAKASDDDGEIESYNWTKVSGGNASLSDANTAKVRAYNLVEGDYVFKVTVEDNKGAKASDEVRVTVKKSANQSPVVNAGDDKTITLPTNSLSIEGMATDADGEIASYKWIQISGGMASLSQTTSANLRVSQLTEGIYIFRLIAEDNDGASNSDDVTVTVKGSPPPDNVMPVVNAGSDRTIRLPANSLSLQGSATDQDGSVASYKWTQVSGRSASLSQTNSANARAYNLSEGTYVFRLTVEDDKGASDADEVKVYVIKGLSGDIVPVDYSGPDRSNSLPGNLLYTPGSELYDGNQ